MNKHIRYKPQRQRGFTLIIAMVFLVLLMLLGTTVANNNSMQIRLAGNTRQRDLAFQAAEHALRSAGVALGDTSSEESAYIQDVISKDPAVATVAKPNHVLLNGAAHANDAAYWKNTFDWSTSSSKSVTGISSELAASNPRYAVEQMPKVSPCPGETGTSTCFYYRVTTLGVGKDDTAAVVLQSMYKFKK